LFDLLPPDIAAFFNDTQMQFEATQQSMAAVRSHTRLADPDIVSVTSSDSDNEGQSSKDKTKSRSPDIVPETQVANRFAVDCLVGPTFIIIYYRLTQFPDGPNVVDWARVEAQEALYRPGSLIRCRYMHVFS
jgi:hypothetical protein